VPDDLDHLARMFRRFAEREFVGYSAAYTALAYALAEDPRPGAALLAAPPRQRRAILLFAAVQYLLRGPARDHPLARYYPTLGGDRAPDDGLAPAFRALAAEHHAELERTCATRTTQTNEARRAALLRPGFALAASTADRPIALIELGTSAGLLLLPDRYRYRYTGAGRDVTVGRPDAPRQLLMEVEVRGAGWLDPVGTEPAIAERVGLDLNPVSPADPAATDWLRSCIWPEHTARLARLDAALAEAAAVRPRLVRGDMVAELPAVLAAVDDTALPVVFASNAITYLPDAALVTLVSTLAAVGARRDLAVILNEASTAGLRLFDRTAPRAAALNVGTPVYVHWRAGTPTVTTLGQTGPHGEWLSWTPAQHAWLPLRP